MNNIIVLRNRTGKVFCFAIFGFFGLIMALTVFPIINFLEKDELSLRKKKLYVLKRSFRAFIWFLHIFAYCTIDTSRLKKLGNLKSHIVVANHPSLIDIIFLIEALPNPDCIVKQELFNNFWLKGVVQSLFISSSTDFELLLQRCKSSLDFGNNIIIFPEGSRTPGGEKKSPQLKRGAVQIALRSNCNILPIHIKTVNYVGLSKHDSLFKVHTSGYINFYCVPKKEIVILEEDRCCIPKVARCLTKKIEEQIFTEESI